MTEQAQIGVMGGGAWGTALAATIAARSRKQGGNPASAGGRETGSGAEAVRIWVRGAEIAQALSAGRGNPVYLPGIALPKLNASTDLSHLAGCDAILAVVPAQFARANFAALAPHIKPGKPVILCSKGIEQASLCLMTEVLAQTLPEAVPAVLSGPSFAVDVARGLPTAVTLACADRALGERLMGLIGHAAFRPYWTSDLVGAEVGGAVKNVLAIACGIVEGLGLGKSAHAALIARGFAEMTRLGVAMGARAETLAGLCGLGDLVLTCSSVQSRNMSFGLALGQGRSAAAILAERRTVTEGVATAPALAQVAARAGVDMPICAAVQAVLSERVSVTGAIDALLTRPFKGE